VKRVLVVVSVLFIALTVSPASAGIGAQYGSRDPHSCRAYNGPLTPAFAAAVFACDSEYQRGLTTLVLVSRVSVQLAAPRPFDMGRDAFSDVNTRAIVYPITGNYSEYDCSKLGGIYPAGGNCLHMDWVNARGECYMTNSSGWHCTMVGGTQAKYENGVAPPAGN